MGPIIGVPPAKLGIEQVSKPLRLDRLCKKLDNELVVTHSPSKSRTDMPVAHSRTRCQCSLSNRAFDLLVDQMLAEGGESVARPARDRDEWRIERLEADRVANDVRPQASTS